MDTSYVDCVCQEGKNKPEAKLQWLNQNTCEQTCQFSFASLLHTHDVFLDIMSSFYHVGCAYTWAPIPTRSNMFFSWVIPAFVKIWQTCLRFKWSERIHNCLVEIYWFVECDVVDQNQNATRPCYCWFDSKLDLAGRFQTTGYLTIDIKVN